MHSSYYGTRVAACWHNKEKYMPPLSADADGVGYRHIRKTLTQADISAISKELAAFLQQQGISDTYIGNTKLIVTEILSNLIKHPLKPADHIEIRADVTDGQIYLEVIDNSTPFANCAAKCKNALSALPRAVTGTKCCYGLSYVVTLCKDTLYIPLDKSADNLNHFRVSVE